MNTVNIAIRIQRGVSAGGPIWNFIVLTRASCIWLSRHETAFLHSVTARTQGPLKQRVLVLYIPSVHMAAFTCGSRESAGDPEMMCSVDERHIP